MRTIRATLEGRVYYLKMPGKYVPLMNRRRQRAMSDQNEITGKFIYEQDSKRYHRFKIETDAGIVGTVYVPKDKQSMPKKLILEYAK